MTPKFHKTLKFPTQLKHVPSILSMTHKFHKTLKFHTQLKLGTLIDFNYFLCEAIAGLGPTFNTTVFLAQDIIFFCLNYRNIKRNNTVKL